MSRKFSKKRVNEGRIEVYDAELSNWVALAMVPLAERARLDDLEMEASQQELPESANAKQRLEQFDAHVLLGSGTTESKPRSRTVGRLFGLIVGLALVAAVVFFSK